ncbi:MAG: 50S ribosomal protein L19 [Candidatus Omnitrophica bacterium]|nr:50S ribosomal protein L19 [Candidatus Omnitrophota bacterium]
MDYLKAVEEKYLQKDRASFRVGDIVRVHQKVLEEGKSRIQVFEGRVIGRKGSGLRESFIVRRVTFGEGVERHFPLHSPQVVKIQVMRSEPASKAKLYYTRKEVDHSR